MKSQSTVGTRTRSRKASSSGFTPGAISTHARSNLALLGDGNWIFALLVAAILLAGGTNPYYPYWRGAAELFACAMIGVSAVSSRSSWPRLVFTDWLAIAVVALVMLQLIPLPPQIWTAFPGREAIIRIDSAVFGSPIWRPLSLAPEATVRSLLTLLPPLAGYIAVRTGDSQRRNAMLAGAMGAVAVSIAIALLQQILGPDSFVHPFTMADRKFPIGLFTNHNHLADFLACALPLALVATDARLSNNRLALGLAAFTSFAIVAIVLSGSRAGLALLPLALIGVTVAMLRKKRPAIRLLLIPMTLAVLLVVIAVFYLSGIGDIAALSRSRALMDDQRLDFWPLVPEGITMFFPVGSGFGTFADAFRMHQPLDNLGQLYINHAHNDYMEIAYEGGLAGIALLACFLGWYANTVVQSVRCCTCEIDCRIALLAASAISVPLAHSLVDYPLRTAAVSTLAAMAVAILAQVRLKWVAAG